MRKAVLILVGLLMALGMMAQVNVISMDVMRARHAVDTLVINDLYLEGFTDGSNAFTAIQLDTIGALSTWLAGKIEWDTASRAAVINMGVEGVRVQVGQEMYQLVYNNSGSQIDNGKICYGSGVNTTYGVIEIGLADNTVLLKSLSITGVATHDIPNGTLGLVTVYGIVRDFNASGLTPALPIYLGTSGAITPTRPRHPNKIMFVGICLSNSATTGKIHVDLSQRIRTFVAKSYNFTSQGIGAGTYWRAGYYDASASDANLDEGGATVNYGTANVPYAAHPFIVAGGVGVTDAGVVGLRVTGTSITDAGVLTTSDADTIVTDITTLSADDYVEGKKFVSTVQYELITMSGSPTAYSLDFNYGYAKYEDFANHDFTVIGFEAVGLAGATDTDFEMVLYHHSSTGWTYHATAFEAGGTEIANMYDDMQPYDNLTNGIDYAWKRVGLNYFFEGADSEGVIIKIVTGANNSVQSMDIHIGGVIEDI